MTSRQRLTVAVLLFAGLSAFHPARAAQSYDNCTGFIDSIPTTITEQGVWCLRHDLATNIASGNAIEVAANNVTIDCNDFKLGGLAAGNASGAIGIHAYGRQNTTIRHCNIRGFHIGIYLISGAGHLVEDNRLDNNLEKGIITDGDNIRVRRNAVYDTGGLAGGTLATGILSSGDIVDNIVSGVFTDRPDGYLYGIRATGRGTRVLGNSVSGISQTAMQGGDITISIGITLESIYIRASDNQIVGSGVNNKGIYTTTSENFCLDNTVGGFITPIDISCTSDRNFSPP